MKIDVLTLFPAMFAGPLDESIVKRARAEGLLDLAVHNLRDYTHDRHRTVDDKPFGGGPGMLLKPEPIFEAVEKLSREKTRLILLTPAGRKFNHSIARELARLEHLLLVCGSYEGFDERVREALANDELSIGDYVLTNGALPAMVIIDAVTRLLPGANAPPLPQSKSAFMNQAIRDLVQSRQLRKNPVDVGVGDTVRVHTKVVEGDKERIQIFTGVVIGKRGRGLNEAFTVRRISYGEGVERVFPMHSPRIDKVEVEREGQVRRAKLTYLRTRIGKGATLVREKETAEPAAAK